LGFASKDLETYLRLYIVELLTTTEITDFMTDAWSVLLYGTQ